MLENIKQSISGRKKNLFFNPPLSFFKAALLALAFIFCIAGQANFSLAQTATAPTAPASSTPSATATAPVKQSYYLISLTWDSEKNTIALNKDENGKPAVSLTEENLIKDTGGGSQFFAMVFNFQNQAKKFSDGQMKLFLGRWELKGSEKMGEIKTTVPYSPQGQKVIIADAKNPKMGITVDVSNFAAPLKKVATKVPTAAITPANQVGNNSVILGWVIIIIMLLILGGGGYFAYRFWKKRKADKASDLVVPPNIN